ncbi:hypothetical protein WICPIJ_004880 [Wickerhamomyces pijperi]|uniref:Uncharacterized protein n=1 Tax=Wickerhamomyces pijperi TaxID=599730 RepID=A0A9P8Q6S3_WICPI|nr:hypothetical protein WICPIJ_004880 [Wickerhamomyces pijperi]
MEQERSGNSLSGRFERHEDRTQTNDTNTSTTDPNWNSTGSVSIVSNGWNDTSHDSGTGNSHGVTSGSSRRWHDFWRVSVKTGVVDVDANEDT